MSIIWLAFLTGLTTGGISCLAVQGGLLATAVSGEGTQSPGGIKKNIPLVGLFIIFKLLGYTIVGFLLGFLGSTLVLAPRILGIVQIAVGGFMVITALRLIDAHPIFRYFVITPPRWTYRLLKNTSRSGSWFAPALLGLFTVFMPCGVTQATMAVAIASGSPWMGAAIMAAFVLGTSPVFLALGATVVELLQKKIFSYAAAAIVGVFAVLSINGGIGLTGSPYTLQNLYHVATTPWDELTGGGTSAPIVNGKQQVTIDVGARGYTASVTTLKKGVPVHLTMVTHGSLGCSRAFTIPEFNISKILPLSGTDTIDFTPQKTGILAYSCSMGMYTGQFTVED
jgi:sulfite exporter TauE/SafE